MATAPQFATSPNAGTPATLTAANTATDGTGATGRALVFTASSGTGSVLPMLRLMHLGTNVATLIRVFRNNGSDPETASNNALIAERAIAANTVSQTAESVVYEIDFAQLFDAGGLFLKGHASTPERVYVTLATAVAAGIKITPINGGDL